MDSGLIGRRSAGLTIGIVRHRQRGCSGGRAAPRYAFSPAPGLNQNVWPSIAAQIGHVWVSSAAVHCTPSMMSRLRSTYSANARFDTRASSVSIRRSQPRSEEHTSELQSHHDIVCRLLLEKKKKHTPQPKTDKDIQHTDSDPAATHPS